MNAIYPHILFIRQFEPSRLISVKCKKAYIEHTALAVLAYKLGIFSCPEAVATGKEPDALYEIRLALSVFAENYIYRPVWRNYCIFKIAEVFCIVLCYIHIR